MKYTIEGNTIVIDGDEDSTTFVEISQEGQSFDNVVSLAIKVQCDSCRREITRQVKVVTQREDYCLACFSTLQHFPYDYRIIGKLDYALFAADWSAEEELFLLEAVEKYGFGNWQEIAENMPTDKSIEEIQQHYLTCYLETTTFLPTCEVLTRKDSKGRNDKAASMKWRNKVFKEMAQRGKKTKRGRISLKEGKREKVKGSNPAEMVGYMPKRFEFQVQYDNDAELLLAEMEFNEDDSEEEKRAKFRLMEIYNIRLSQRIKRKEFVISRQLLSPHQERTKVEKEIANMMKPFARYSTHQDHQHLINGLTNQLQIRQRIKYLQQQAKGTKPPPAQKVPPKEKRRGRREKRYQEMEDSALTQQEQSLCAKYKLSAGQFQMLKETAVREAFRQGRIGRGGEGEEGGMIDVVFEADLA